MASVVPARASSVVLAGIADAGLVLVFVLIGRRSHEEGNALAGTLETWWPFLCALAVGWVASRAWRSPTGIARPGLVIWAVTVVGGMALRKLSGQGVQVSFVIVAAVVLGVFLVGWRAIATVLVARRARRAVTSSS